MPRAVTTPTNPMLDATDKSKPPTNNAHICPAVTTKRTPVTRDMFATLAAVGNVAGYRIENAAESKQKAQNNLNSVERDARETRPRVRLCSALAASPGMAHPRFPIFVAANLGIMFASFTPRI